MPLARILTHSVEAASSVIKQLEARGYTVETLPPGKAAEKPADLEIVLDKAPVERALSEAAILAKDTNTDVFIGAGTFHSRKEDLHQTHVPGSLQVPSVEDTVNGVAAGLRNKRDLLAKALWEQRATMREARRLQRERVRQEQARVAAEAERLRADALSKAQGSGTEPETVAAQVAANGEHQPIAEISAQQSLEANGSKQIAAGAESDLQLQHTVQEQGTEAATATNAPSLIRTGDDVVSAPLAQRPEHEPSVPSIGTNHLSPELTEPARQAITGEGAAAPVQTADEVLAWAQRQVFAVQPREDASHRFRSAWKMRRANRKRLYARSRDWRAAVIISSLFALLLMLGWRVVTRGPISPLPAAVTNQPNLQQEVPFGGVTLVPSGAGVAGSLAPAAHTGTALRALPANVHSNTSARAENGRPAASGQHIEGEAKVLATHPPGGKRPPVRTSRSKSYSEEDIAEDEVIIRHFPPKPPTPPAEQKASLKRYSDLN